MGSMLPYIYIYPYIPCMDPMGYKSAISGLVGLDGGPGGDGWSLLPAWHAPLWGAAAPRGSGAGESHRLPRGARGRRMGPRGPWGERHGCGAGGAESWGGWEIWVWMVPDGRS